MLYYLFQGNFGHVPGRLKDITDVAESGVKSGLKNLRVILCHILIFG
jgi:hypothetical protein